MSRQPRSCVATCCADDADVSIEIWFILGSDVATKHGQVECVKVLVAAGADVNEAGIVSAACVGTWWCIVCSPPRRGLLVLWSSGSSLFVVHD